MRGIYTPVTKIRRQVFAAIAKMAYEGGDYASRVEEIPFEIIPADTKEKERLPVSPQSPETITVGMELEIVDRKYRVDAVDDIHHEVSLQDITFNQSTGFPIFRREPFSFVNRYLDRQPTRPEAHRTDEKSPAQESANHEDFNEPAPDEAIHTASLEQHQYRITEDTLGTADIFHQSLSGLPPGRPYLSVPLLPPRSNRLPKGCIHL